MICKVLLKIFKGKEKGIHGPCAIWQTTEGYQGYWAAFKAFLLTNE